MFKLLYCSCSYQILSISWYIVLLPIDGCQRGRAWCTNNAAEAGNCCSDFDCNLDDVRKLPYDPALGIRDICYKRCDSIRCYPTSKLESSPETGYDKRT